MVTQDSMIHIANGVVTTNVTFFGLSTDSKPTAGIGNGSCFIEMDTTKVYFFDADNAEWLEWGASNE